ncbi:hypothetical protein [Lysobacter gummosus]
MAAFEGRRGDLPPPRLRAAALSAPDRNRSLSRRCPTSVPPNSPRSRSA